jgi:predicted hydrocarbon binding protein
MSHPLNMTANGMLALSRSSLSTLRAALLRDGGPEAAVYLQEAGYAGGDAVWQAFKRWLNEQTSTEAVDLDVQGFQGYASDFFAEAGWGRIEIGTLGGAVATIDSADWGEADPSAMADQPCCHLTTGMFADLFGRVAGHTVAVLEVECRSAGAPSCRFLVGSQPVMEQVYDAIGRGERYDSAVLTTA